MRAAIFSCRGLGDGLISLILARNLWRSGWSPILYHPFLSELSSWFPWCQIQSFPKKDHMRASLHPVQQIFVFFEQWGAMQEVMECGKAHFQDRLRILNPIATTRRNYLFWEEGKFDGQITFVENLVRYCQTSLDLQECSADNGITPPKELEEIRYPRRIIIHPTSSRAGKNWPLSKYKQLQKKLQEDNWDPVFVFSQKEKEQLSLEGEGFSSLDTLARFVYGSAYFIGNDSGIGHLASCLGIPTITICRHHKVAQFWRPGWSSGAIASAPSWIPNIKGLRWRDKYWGKWISCRHVLQTFEDLIDTMGHAHP